MKWTEKIICDALCHKYYGLVPFTHNICIPNIRSFLLYTGESDLVALTNSKWLKEYEIKISVADLKKDLKKAKHLFWNEPKNLVSELWYAMPKDIYKEELNIYIPDYAGIALAYIDKSKILFEIKRKAIRKESARKLTDYECFRIARLGSIRYWINRYKESKS